MPPKIAKETLKKLHPKLRMVTDGDATVNILRCERAAALAVESPASLKNIKEYRTAETVPQSIDDLKKKPRQPPALKRVTGAVRANVFVYMRDAEVPEPDVRGRPNCSKGQIVQVQAPLDEIPAIAAQPGVMYVEMAEPLKSPVVTTDDPSPAPPSASDRRFGNAAKHKFGEDVLIGIIDVQGFDFATPISSTTTARPASSASGIRAATSGRRRTTATGPRSTRSSSTARSSRPPISTRALTRRADAGPAGDRHRAAVAADGRLARHARRQHRRRQSRRLPARARSPACSISLPQEDEDRRLSFYDSSRLADAVDYLLRLGEQTEVCRCRSTSASAPTATPTTAAPPSRRWIDAALATPGRAVTVAAGNAGQEKGESEDDIGWIMGRIHTSGTYPRRGSRARPRMGRRRQRDHGRVRERAGDLVQRRRIGSRCRSSRPAASGSARSSRASSSRTGMLPDGTMLSVYNEVFHPANGLNYISVYLSPFFSQPENVIGVPAGVLDRPPARASRCATAAITPGSSATIRSSSGRVGEREAWSFPSFFTERSLVDDSHGQLARLRRAA